jgi:Ca-activated chloride channel family protein
MRRLCLLACVLAVVASVAAQKPRLPRERRLDSGIELRRDPATGELRYSRRAAPPDSPPAEAEAASPAPIRVRVRLVELSVNVLQPDGAHLLGLTRDDFRIYEAGVPQQIVHFDASTEPAGVVLVFDASPSVFRDLAEMKQAARALAAHLGPRDEVAVVAFSASTHLVLPFSTDRVLLERALESVAVSRDPSAAPGSSIYEAVYLAVQELFAGRRGRKAVVLLTDGQDSGLGLTWSPASTEPRAGADAHRLSFEDVCRALTAAGAEVYAISTQNRPRAMTDAWLAARRGSSLITAEAREQGMAHYTLYLAELVRRAGGRLYFLRELPTLADIYRRIAENLRAQYTLGYYPSEPAARGWRALRVEVPAHPGARIPHRAAYYVAASEK